MGEAIGSAASGGEVVALFGALGSGKTTLVRGLASGLGAAPEQVSSPTFVLIQEYRGRVLLVHADLYRIPGSEELHHIGFDEYLKGDAVLAVEWAERALDILPGDRLEIHLNHGGKYTRLARLTARGRRSRKLLASTVHRLTDP